MSTMTILTENAGATNEKQLWLYTETSEDQNSTITLDTAGKFVDKDIRVTINAKSGSASVTSGQSITKNPTVTWDATNKKIVASYSGSKSITGTVATEGWIKTVGSNTVTTSGSTSASPVDLQSTLVAGNIKNGVTVFGVEGTYIGADNPATITSGDATINSLTYTYNSTNANFDITGSATIGTPTVGTAGYVSDEIGTKNTNTASVSTAVAKVALNTTKTGGSYTVKPTLARTAKPTEDTWTDAASGSAVTTKPTKGPYVQIDAAASTNILTIKPQVSTAGYGTTSNYSYAEGTFTVGAAKADTRYIPIKTGSATVPSGVLVDDNASLSGTTLTVQASVTPTVSAGWVASGTAGTVKISGTVPTEIKTASGSGDITPSAGMLISKVTIAAASIGNSTTVPSDYTENTSVTVPSQGYLMISAGWIGNTVISLDQMLEGKADTAGTAANHILTGYVAYDVDGKKLTGTIDTYNGSYTVATA